MRPEIHRRETHDLECETLAASYVVSLSIVYVLRPLSELQSEKMLSVES